jgi:hypothetical protein
MPTLAWACGIRMADWVALLSTTSVVGKPWLHRRKARWGPGRRSVSRSVVAKPGLHRRGVGGGHAVAGVVPKLVSVVSSSPLALCQWKPSLTTRTAKPGLQRRGVGGGHAVAGVVPKLVSVVSSSPLALCQWKPGSTTRTAKPRLNRRGVGGGQCGARSGDRPQRRAVG